MSLFLQFVVFAEEVLSRQRYYRVYRVLRKGRVRGQRMTTTQVLNKV